jgi:hypothetical protein
MPLLDEISEYARKYISLILSIINFTKESDLTTLVENRAFVWSCLGL